MKTNSGERPDSEWCEVSWVFHAAGEKGDVQIIPDATHWIIFYKDLKPRASRLWK